MPMRITKSECQNFLLELYLTPPHAGLSLERLRTLATCLAEEHITLKQYHDALDYIGPGMLCVEERRRAG